MITGVDVFMTPEARLSPGLHDPGRTLRIEPDGYSNGAIVLYLGHVGYPDHRELVISQLRQLEGCISTMRLHLGVSAEPPTGPDDPTDEPDDEPFTGTCNRCDHAPNLHRSTNDGTVGCVAHSVNGHLNVCGCDAVFLMQAHPMDESELRAAYGDK